MKFETKELDQLWPERTETVAVQLPSGIRMQYYVRGQASQTAILLHGFPELGLSWHRQFAGLAQDYRLVAPDMRGYGGSDAPGKIRDYGMPNLVEDVLGLAQHLKLDRFHLVGHDWGGAVAWQFAQQYPKRLLSLSVLNCPPIQLFLRSLWRPKQLGMSWYIFFFQLPWLPHRYLTSDPAKQVRRLFRGTAVNRSAFTDSILEPYVAQFSNGIQPGINYYRANLRYLSSQMKNIDVPTRLIWALGDKALGPWFAKKELYQPYISKFDRVLIPAEVSGHWVQQEASELVNQALHSHWNSCEQTH